MAIIIRKDKKENEFMLHKEIKRIIDDQESQKAVLLTAEEEKYAREKGLIDADKNVELISLSERMQPLYLERADKETDEVIAEESTEFLQQPISYFRTHMNEYLYIESDSLRIVGTDSLTLEVNDVFGSYEMMFGLSVQKKYEQVLRCFLEENLSQDHRFVLLFNSADGLWDVNIPLSGMQGFSEENLISEVLGDAYIFLFKLAAAIE